REAILPYIAICLKQRKMPPPWAAWLLTNALDKHPKTWDDVFGRPSYHRDTWRLFEEWRIVSEAVHMILEGGRKIDAISFFEDLAARVGMSAGTVKRRFYTKRAKALLELEIKHAQEGITSELAGQLERLAMNWLGTFSKHSKD